MVKGLMQWACPCHDWHGTCRVIVIISKYKFNFPYNYLLSRMSFQISPENKKHLWGGYYLCWESPFAKNAFKRSLSRFLGHFVFIFTNLRLNVHTYELEDTNNISNFTFPLFLRLANSVQS